jgi:hypothetical protein
MEDRIADKAVADVGEDGALVISDISNRHEGILVNASSSTKKPSLLRASLLRRTTTRVTNKRSLPVRTATAIETRHIITTVASTDIPVGCCGCCDATTPQIISNSGRDKSTTSSSHEIDTATTRTPADDVGIGNTKTFQTVEDCDSDNGDGNDNNIQDDTSSSHDENNDYLNISVNVSVDEDEVEMELNGPTRVESPDVQQTTGSAGIIVDSQRLLQPDENSDDEEVEPELELELNPPTRVEQPDVQQKTGTDVITVPLATKILSQPDQSSCDEDDVELELNRPTSVKQPDLQKISIDVAVDTQNLLQPDQSSCVEAEKVQMGLNRSTSVKQPNPQTTITTVNTATVAAKRISKPDQSSCDEEEVKLNRPPRMKQPDQQITNVPTATVASTKNLSIVVKGNDIVVEYRDDNGSERKKSSHQLLQNSFPGDAAVMAPSASNSMVSTQKQTARRRPRGIMKRPRDSNLTYHHPRRPQPPPLPPPGYRETTSPLSWMTATTTDSTEDPYAERQRLFLNAPPTAITTTKKKRVKFDEKLLSEQYQSSKLRRRAKYEQRRSFGGILSMAMPVIMPYLIAVLILIASSMIPLPATTLRRQQSSNNLTLSLEPKFANGRKNKRGRTRQSMMPTLPPIFIDVASRSWDERTNLKAEVGSKSIIVGNAASSATAAAGAITVFDGNALSKRSNKKSDDSKGLKVVGTMEPSKRAIAVAHRFERRNPVAKTVASLFKLLRSIFFPFRR